MTNSSYSLYNATMTRKQLKRISRDKKIMELYNRLPIETIAEKFNISVSQVYRIVKKHE